MSASKTCVFARAVAHLASAYALACRAAADDVLSPWGNTAMSIHLAAAGLSWYLPGPVQATEHVDCLTARRAAQREPLSVDAECGFPLIVLPRVRARMATALSEAESLQR
jgi:hypothetical protein